MTSRRALELMEIELECITRADYCGRNCHDCDIVQDAAELKEAYRYVIDMMKRMDGDLK